MRIIAYLVLLAAGVWIGSSLGLRARTAQVPVANSGGTPLQMPAADLSPREVVVLQVEALRGFLADRESVRQCYVLASPANRAVTGPLDRFTNMVQNEEYRALVSGANALVGQAVTREGRATVLVTLMDENDQPAVFRFFLSRQTEPEYENCWMTDAVATPRSIDHPEISETPNPSV